MRVTRNLLAVAGLVSSTQALWLGQQAKRAPAILEALVGASQAASSVTSTASSTTTSTTTSATSITTTAATAATTTTATAAATTTAAKSTGAASTANNNVASGGASSLSASTLLQHGFNALGQNANSNNGACWIGSDGPNTNVVTNGSGQSIVVVVWGPNGSWMTGGTAPLITQALGPGSSFTVSCADNVPGGMAAVYSDMISSGNVISPYGQVDNTWVEFTYGIWGTYDVSREINMSGRPITVTGPSCTASMSQCVFTCFSGNTCGAAGTYQLQNCNAANGGGSDGAAMNGGCTSGSNLHLQTTFA